MSFRALGFLLAVLLVLSGVTLLRAQNPDSKEPKAEAATSLPDFSGVWNRRGDRNTRYFGYGFSPEELPMTPWALERFKNNKPSFGSHGVVDPNDPTYDCYLPGIPRIYVHPAPFELIETPGRVIQYFQYDGFVRQIWTDGRPHLKMDDPDDRLWMGDSIGHWEGDTLVVDTTGFNDKTWLDRAGHPHSDQLHEMERIHRVDQKTLQIDLTIEDPIAYTQPITAKMIYQLEPKWHIEEHACTDYPRPTAP